MRAAIHTSCNITPVDGNLTPSSYRISLLATRASTIVATLYIRLSHDRSIRYISYVTQPDGVPTPILREAGNGPEVYRLARMENGFAHGSQ